MDIAEVSKILALAASFDNRKTGDTDSSAWMMVIGTLDFDDAKYAVVHHYEASSERIMPADIIRLAKMRRDLRERPQIGALGDTIEGDIPDADPDDVDAYLAALREGRMRPYDDGTAKPRPVRALLSRAFPALQSGEEK